MKAWKSHWAEYSALMKKRKAKSWKATASKAEMKVGLIQEKLSRNGLRE
jgi:hypothetical protein